MVTVQLSNTELLGLRALIKESETRRAIDINNRYTYELNNRQNIPKIPKNIEYQSPILNNIRNLQNTTSENRPARLFTEENNYNNRLNMSNINSINSKRSNINIQTINNLNLKRKPPTLAPGSSAIQYLDWADSMEKFLKVCGNLEEWLYKEKGEEFINYDEEYEHTQTLQFIQAN